MNTLYRSTLGLIGGLALAGAAFAQVPATNDTSTTDGKFNTGMGTGALGGPNPQALTGTENTASGYQALYENESGSSNTASGYGALASNTRGNSNTASGWGALTFNTTGNNNTASGTIALFFNTTGSENTASGFHALFSNTTGNYNTAAGNEALVNNTTASNNTAFGYESLDENTTGSNNTASGSDALFNNTTGNYNTASGYEALYSNTTADYNTASGYGALYNNNGHSNTASGYEALESNTSGIQNTATGVHALAFNTTGSNNIAEGWRSGYNLTTGSYNIDIGSPGVAAESGVIRIGTITGTTSTQSATYVAGIYGVKTATAGTAVFIDSSGQLGTVSSSIRYKEDVQPIASASERLLQLRPVRFRYKKADASGEKPIQYGLIAEEVAEVYPELVVRDATTGRIDAVRYDELAPMLLNEIQQQHAQMAEKFDAQASANAAQAAEIRDLKQQMTEMHAVLVRLQAKDEFVAQR
jgi:hypothetical protein